MSSTISVYVLLATSSKPTTDVVIHRSAAGRVLPRQEAENTGRSELVKVHNLCTRVKVQVTQKKATQVEVKVLKKYCT